MHAFFYNYFLHNKYVNQGRNQKKNLGGFLI